MISRFGFMGIRRVIACFLARINFRLSEGGYLRGADGSFYSTAGARHTSAYSGAKVDLFIKTVCQ